MAVYLSKHQGLAGSDRVTIENYRAVIIKIGISKLPEPLLKGHKYYSANIDKYNSNSSIAETINDYLTDLNAYVDKLPSKKQKEIFNEDKGYSGNKWEGSHYKNTRDLKTSEIAKLIKKELDIEFNEAAKFSVTTDVFSGGSSINVTITDLSFIPYTEHFLTHLKAGKSIEDYNEENHDQYNRYSNRFNDEFNTLIKKVERIANQYNFDDSDSQTDYFHVRYYEHVKFDEDRYLLKHYPDNPEAKRRKDWDEHWAKSKANSKAKADSRKGKYKKGTVIFFKAEMHKSWHKYMLPNGLYLAKIVKSPNGRGMFSNYGIKIYQNIDVMRSDNVEYLRKKGYDEYFFKNEYGTFYEGSQVLNADEKNFITLDDPGATTQPFQEVQPTQEIKHRLPQGTKVQISEQERETIITPEVEEEKTNEKSTPRQLRVKAYEQVTIDNYFSHSFDIRGWPVNLKNGHEFITGETEGFKNIDLAQEDEQIRAAIDTYLNDLNEYLEDNPEKAAKVEPNAKPVREISPSVKLIKRFANLHGKTLTEKQLSTFIKTMQKAMATQQIRATDPHQGTLYHIQDVLVDTYNDAEPGDQIQFTIKGADKYKVIGKSEAEMLSMKLVKRYIGLIGKTDTTKQRRLHGDISKAIDTGKITAQDPLISPLQKSLISLQAAFTGKGKLIIPDAELSGLKGLGFIPAMIAAAVGKGIEHFAHKALKPSSEVNGLGCDCQAQTVIEKERVQPYAVNQDDDTIQSIGEVKKMEFDLIGLDNLYLELIGEACRPTSFLIYGPGGSGKSTFTLLFGNYMAQKGNRVLYVAGEQKDTPVFTKMVNRLKIQDSKNLGFVKRVENHDLNNYDILVIDSKDSINYTLEDFIKQREQYPHLSFVILSQATKNGGFTGTEKWRNEVDSLIFCEKMMAYTNRDKNRWGGSSEIKILDLIKQ